jgi:hypothetical protein
MKIKTLTLPVTALLAASALAACGGSSGSGGSGNGIASKSPVGIVNAASQAAARASSVHIAGTITSGGTPITLDMHLVAGKGATGQISSRGLSAKLISVGRYVYINGAESFWKAFAGPTIAQKLAGKWLKTPATGSFSSFGSLTNMATLFSKAFGSHGTLAKGPATTVNGQQVVAVRDTSKGGTLYVATTGSPYPIEIVKTGSSAGQVTFDQYNQPVSLAPPAGAVDLTSLGL